MDISATGYLHSPDKAMYFDGISVVKEGRDHFTVYGVDKGRRGKG